MGFTLIEMLVVVAIIAVMSAIAVVSFGSVNSKARDSRRVADLQKMAIALEMAKQVGSTYPATTAVLTTGGYLQVLPVDPKGFLYEYTRTPDVYHYVLRAYVENAATANLSPTAGTCNGASKCNYEIKSP